MIVGVGVGVGEQNPLLMVMCVSVSHCNFPFSAISNTLFFLTQPLSLYITICFLRYLVDVLKSLKYKILIQNVL